MLILLRTLFSTEYAVNSILYQRGVYSPETFERTQQYGITLFTTKDPEIKEYFDKVLPFLESMCSTFDNFLL